MAFSLQENREARDRQTDRRTGCNA